MTEAFAPPSLVHQFRRLDKEIEATVTHLKDDTEEYSLANFQQFLFNNYAIGVYAMIFSDGEFVFEVWNQRSESRWDLRARQKGYKTYSEALEIGLWVAVEFILNK